jgi:hypothetical protein
MYSTPARLFHQYSLVYIQDTLFQMDQAHSKRFFCKTAAKLGKALPESFYSKAAVQSSRVPVNPMMFTRASTRLNAVKTPVLHVAKTKCTQDDVILDANEDQPDARMRISLQQNPRMKHTPASAIAKR